MKTIIRGLRPDDVDGYAELCEARDGLDEKSARRRAELVHFMAFNNPVDDGEPCYFVAETDGKITGHMGRMPTWYWIDGQRHRAAFMHDLFIHPMLQDKGQAFFVTMRLYKACENACPSFAAMCWTNAINIKLQQTRKYHELWARRFVHLLRADKQLRVLDRLGPAAGPAKLLAKPAANLALRGVDVALRGALGRGRRIERVEDVDARFDRLTERIGPRMLIAPVKDSAYLRFKYLDRPGIEVTILAAVGAPGELLGFVVLREPKGAEDDVGTLLELCAARDDAATIRALLGAAIGHYRERGVTAIECVATDPAFIAELKRQLFLPRGDALPLFFCNLKKYPRPDALTDIDKWHHGFGDSEGPY